MRKYEVLEDNGGGLHLAVFSEDEKEVVYFHSGYEYYPGELLESIEAICEGAQPELEWDGNCGGYENEYGENPQELYDDITSDEYGCEVIADNEGIYPEKMGAAACLEFNIIRE